MTTEEITSTWDKAKVTADLKAAFDNNSESQLPATLKDNSFLFYNGKSGTAPSSKKI